MAQLNGRNDEVPGSRPTSTATKLPRVKAALKNLAVVLIGFTMAGLLAELLLLPFIPAPNNYRYPQTTHDRDPTLGWIPKPNQQSFTVDKSVLTNSLGLRNREIRTPKPSGVFRVLCLGDSQTFGNAVDQDKTYSAQLEVLLSERSQGTSVEVVNAGVQVYDTVQQVDLFERLAPTVSPDVVTIGFYLNDIGEVLRTDKLVKVTDDTGEFRREGFIKRFTPYRLIYLLKRSRLVTLVYWRVRMLAAAGHDNPQHQVLTGDTPPRYETAWDLIKQALRRAQAYADSHGARLIVFPIPSPQEFRGDYPNEQYRSRFIALAEQLNIDCFDPKPVMDTTPRAYERLYVTWDGHMSALGHRIVAELIAERILSAR